MSNTDYNLLVTNMNKNEVVKQNGLDGVPRFGIKGDQ